MMENEHILNFVKKRKLHIYVVVDNIEYKVPIV